MRILLDTNVWIAGLITRGACAELIDYCLSTHQLVISDWILDEVTEKLATRFQYTPDRIREVESWILEISEHFQLEGTLPSISRDVDDNHVLLSVQQAQADCLISGDKDLLDLDYFENIPILKPSDFWGFEDQQIKSEIDGEDSDVE